MIKTCKDCIRFRPCLKTGDVALNFGGGNHICEKFKGFPEKESIVEVKRDGRERWTVALYFRNGTKPTFAQYGSEITDVTDWRYRQKSGAIKSRI
jgi:hypothetical protein